VRCFDCGREPDAVKLTRSGAERLPPKWKEWPAGVRHCGACWSARFAVKAVTLSVSGPADAGNPTEAGEAWARLRQQVCGAWDASTRLANWTVTQLLAGDRHRHAGDERLQPMPATYLYGGFGEFADRAEWDGASASAQSLMRTVEQSYRKRRRQVLWDYSASAQSFRWPVPFPFHEQNWDVALNEHGVPTASLPLPGGRVNLRLRSDLRGKGHRRYQMDRFAALCRGEIKRCEAALYGVRVGPKDMYNGITVRHPGAFGESVTLRLMLKLVGWFPRPPVREAEGVLLVTTGNLSFLTAEQDGYDDWILHGEQIRQKVIGHAAYLQRMADDTKFEKRWPKAARRTLNVDRDRRCVTMRDRLNDFVAQASAMVAGLAERRKVAVVRYDDSERGYLPSFPYFALKRELERKCRDRGVEFVAGSTADDLEGATSELRDG
jgi:hypothetical protein